jgi:hypothetical protein
MFDNVFAPDPQGFDLGRRLNDAVTDPLFMVGLQMVSNHGKPNVGLFDGAPQAVATAQAVKEKRDDKALAQQRKERIGQFLSKKYPEYAQLAMDDPDTALKLATMKGAGKEHLMSVGKSIYNTETGEWITPPGGMAGEDEWGLNPVWGLDAHGKTVLGQVSKTGKFKPLDTGDFTPTPGISNIDAGTSVITRNNRTGAVVAETQKDLAGAEEQKAIGDARGKSVASAPGDYQAAQNALDLVTSLRNDPNRERGTGKSSVFNSIPGSRGYDFQKKVNQTTSGAFMTAIQQMRGMGQLSNAEGSTATAAVTRMDMAMSEEAFLEALNDYEKIIKQGMDRAAGYLKRGRAPAGGGGQVPSTGPSVDDLLRKYGG